MPAQPLLHGCPTPSSSVCQPCPCCMAIPFLPP
jgi:hypothetical protein